MAIRVNYTPYEAVGELATRAGRAQQAVREQQFAEQREAQERAIAAQQALQTQQLNAQAAQTAATLRQRQAAQTVEVASTYVQNRQQLELKERLFQWEKDKFAINRQAAERAFQLQKTQEDRLERELQAEIDQRKQLNLQATDKLNVKREFIKENMNRLNALYQAGKVDDREYISQRSRIEAGQTISLPVARTMPPTKNLTPKQRLDIETKPRFTNTELKIMEKVGQDIAEESLASWWKPGKTIEGWWDLPIGDLAAMYANFQMQTNYAEQPRSKRNQLNIIWNTIMRDRGQDNWDMQHESIQKLMNIPAITDSFWSNTEENGPVVIPAPAGELIDPNDIAELVRAAIRGQ